MTRNDSPTAGSGRLGVLVRLHKALGHPVRLRMLAMLRGGPLCVCQMTSVLRLAASTVSAHLAELRRAGLVVERKEGKWVEYRLDGGGLSAVSWTELEKEPAVARDAALLKQVRRIPLEELCRAELDLTRLGVRLPAHTAPGKDLR